MTNKFKDILETLEQTKGIYELYYSESLGASMDVREHTRGIIDGYDQIIKQLSELEYKELYDEVLEEREKNNELF